MGVFHSLLHPLCLSPGLSSTGLEEPLEGEACLGPASFSSSPLDLSFLCQPHCSLLPLQVAETFTFLSWGHRRPHGVPPRVLTPHLASALCPLPCSGSSLAEPLQIQANSDPRRLPDKTGSQWRHQVLSRMKTVQAESRAPGKPPTESPSICAEALYLHHCW